MERFLFTMEQIENARATKHKTHFSPAKRHEFDTPAVTAAPPHYV